MFDDEFNGVGGSYIVKDGKRERVETTAPANTIPAPEQQQPAAPIVITTPTTEV